MTEPRTLVRTMGRWSLVALAVNSTIGSAIFGLPGAIAGLLGSASPLAVLVSGLAMAVIIACFAEVASQFSGAGGPYLYGRAAFGRLTGIAVGWTFYLAQCAAPAANANLFVSYLAHFFPGVASPHMRVLVITLLVGLLAGVNLIGVRQGAHVSNAFMVAKLLPLAAIIVAGLVAMARHHGAPHALPAGNGNAWLQAMVLLVFSYGGFETGLVPMGEARNPQRDAGFALAAALAICTAVYTLVQWIVVAVPSQAISSERPLAEIARLTMGPWGAALISAAALLSILGYLSAKLLGNPRMTFALAEQGDLPRVFSAVGRRFHTPWFSIAIYAAVVWGLALYGSFGWNVTLSVMARLFYYGVVCAALIALRRKNPAAEAVRIRAGPWIAVLGLLICVVLATQADLSKSLIVAVTFALAIANWLWVRKRTA